MACYRVVDVNEARTERLYEEAEAIIKHWVEHFAWYVTPNWQRRMVAVAVEEELECFFGMPFSRSGGGQQWLGAMAGLYSKIIAEEY